jgi:hypothetical protein
MWPKQANWTHALTFYFQDADAPGVLFQAAAGENASGDVSTLQQELKAKSEALTQKENALKEKDEQLSKSDQTSKDILDKLKTLEDKERDYLAHQKQDEAKVADLEKRLKTQSTSSSKSSGTGGKDQKALEQKLQDAEKKLAALELRYKDVAAKDRQYNDLEAREKAITVKEKQLLSRASDEGSDGTTVASDNELVEENKRLAAELASLKKDGVARPSGAVGAFDGSRIVPPPSFARPPLKPPQIMKPAQSLPSGFNSNMLRRFEAGKTVMMSK